MSRPKKKPSYLLHKPSGQAYARLNGQVVYLGKYGSPESRDRYDDVVASWLEGQSADRFTIFVDELALQYLTHCEGYYVKDGEPTSEISSTRYALRVVVRLFGRDRARSFGPQKLIAVRNEMIQLGWNRSAINKQIGRIRRCFRWGVQQELIPPETLMALQAVSGLRAGRSAAKEPEPVLPVSAAAVDAVKPFVSRQVWAMIQLQRLTGARPGEITQMRGCDLNTAGDLWEYRPGSHKTQHHGRERIIILGKAAQAVVREFLRSDLAEFLFSPAEARREFDEQRKAGRKTPMTPSQRARRRRRKPRRRPGERYSKCGFSAAVRKACERAFGMPDELRNVSKGLPDDEREKRCAEATAWRKEHCWNPHQLRHTAATEIRRTFGLEAAQVVLGHSGADVTQLYAERDLSLARKVAAKLG